MLRKLLVAFNRPDRIIYCFPGIAVTDHSVVVFVCRSTEMDKWTAEQMKTMAVGGNEAARNFFKDKGWTDHQSAKAS